MTLPEVLTILAATSITLRHRGVGVRPQGDNACAHIFLEGLKEEEGHEQGEVPLTMVVKLAFASDPRTRWAAIMLE